ncbi:hypothetical protein H5410_052487 [Solanum commersonii]|uniref:Uncharacterized protein n=1 Tax=Solanum commersonii TaxID=4109 RepID=A0A9J5X3I9_SOLCO|nr:hypothetical protein H5410_052487 [Solanum commersonii]
MDRQSSLMEDFPDLFSFGGNPEASIAGRLLNDGEVERVASLLQRLNNFSGLNTSPDTMIDGDMIGMKKFQWKIIQKKFVLTNWDHLWTLETNMEI